MTPLLPLLALTLLHAAPGETLFVQASALNLRTKPSAGATVRAQVPIGAACTVVSLAPEGWAELKCPQGQGFNRLELLGPKPPDPAQFLAQGQEPGRPLPEALNLLQRAVTLKPDDAPTQQAFRELFWKAEFDRLVRARATDKLLKKELAFPAECGDTSACVKAVLAPAPGTQAAWEELHAQGPDVVHGQLFTDGTFYLRSGAVDAAKHSLTVQLESVTIPSEAVLKALGITGVKDACEPLPPAEYSTHVCGFDYDQNCSPDDCWEPYQSCRESAATECQGCKLACRGTCGDCRTKCGTRNRQECVTSCISATRACEAKCQEPVGPAESECKTQYESCSEKAEREWNRTCKKPCDRVYACVQWCQKRKNGTEGDAWPCVHECEGGLPSQCSDRCLNRFQ